MKKKVIAKIATNKKRPLSIRKLWIARDRPGYNVYVGEPKPVGSKGSWDSPWFNDCDGYFCGEKFEEIMGIKFPIGTVRRIKITVEAVKEIKPKRSRSGK